MPTLLQDFYMIPFKLLEGIIYLSISVIILKRDRKSLLNQIYFISILSWGIYIFLDMILYPLAHFESSYISTITIKSTEWAIPLIANILRDIAILFGGILAFGFLYASIILKFGESYAKQTKIILSLGVSYIIFAGATIFFDVIIHSGDYVKAHFNLGSGVMIFAQIIIFVVAIYYLLLLYSRFSDTTIKKRIGNFILGTSLLLGGIVFFVLVGFMNISAYAAITGPIGHLMWTLGAVFIYKGIITPLNK